MSDRRQKRLEQVRALLAKANSTPYPEEAQTFREHADKLMVQYAIEEWETSVNTPTGRPTPEMRVFDMSWWTGQNPFRQDHWWMMRETADHTRCVAVYWDWVPRKMKVVGLPADLDYFDLLFTQLMLEHGKRLEPRPDPNGEVGHEVFKLRQAGLPWTRITELIYKAELIELTTKEKTNLGTVDANSWEFLKRYYPEVVESVKNRLANFNRRYVRQNGLQHQRNYVKPAVYQRSFSEGFVSEVVHRMRAMRRESEAEKAGDNHMALVLRDIRQIVIQWVDENYPMPEEDDDDKKKKSKALSRTPVFNMEAYAAGTRAGREVNISSNPNKRVGSRKELPR